MNQNPVVKETTEERYKIEIKDGILYNINQESIFELIRDIKDPEHPISLESLDVVTKDLIQIEEMNNIIQNIKVGKQLKKITVEFIPTIPHCSMASIIGLTIKYQLQKFIKYHWIEVNVKKDTHSSYKQLNKQLNDKDRVNAALENPTLVNMIESSLPKII